MVSEEQKAEIIKEVAYGPGWVDRFQAWLEPVAPDELPFTTTWPPGGTRMRSEPMVERIDHPLKALVAEYLLDYYTADPELFRDAHRHLSDFLAWEEKRSRPPSITTRDELAHATGVVRAKEITLEDDRVPIRPAPTPPGSREG